MPNCTFWPMSASTNVRFDQFPLQPVFALTNVCSDQCPLWPISALTNVRFDQYLLRPMSVSTNVRFDQCPLRPMSALTSACSIFLYGWLQLNSFRGLAFNWVFWLHFNAAVPTLLCLRIFQYGNEMLMPWIKLKSYKETFAKPATGWHWRVQTQEGVL